MFHVVAFSESQDPGGATVNVAGVTDGSVKVAGDYIYVPEFAPKLVGAVAYAGTTGVYCRLNSPSLRRVNPWYITPIAQELYPAANVIGCINSNIVAPLEPNEALEAEINSNPAAAEQNTIVAFLADQNLSPVQGRMYTIRASITLALVAGAWASSAITFEDNLPVGNYKIVGAQLVADVAVAFRFQPIGGYHRPGGIASADEDLTDKNLFRYGKLGEWMTFNTQTPPNVEVLSSAAAGAATYYIYIDIMPV